MIMFISANNSNFDMVVESKLAVFRVMAMKYTVS